MEDQHEGRNLNEDLASESNPINRNNLNYIRELRIFKSVVELPEMYMLNLKSRR